MTYQIIYSSESTSPMQAVDLEEILEQARARNAASGITGALVYVDGVFLQILEGEPVKVQTLMASIAKDLRHQTVTVLLENTAPIASFAEWKMAYVSATSEQVAMWAGLSGIADIPTMLNDLRSDTKRTMQLTDGILSVLSSSPASRDSKA
jgi:hypothetical protein